MFLDLITTRRSIRKFQSRPVPRETIALLIEAALRSPSSRGIEPWRFVVVDDPVLLEKLSRAKPHGAGFLKTAPLGIVVCADPSKSDVWVEDASIASVFVHLAAHDLGLGSCWIQIRKRARDDGKTAEAHVKEALSLPGHLTIESIIAIGYPDEVKAPHPKTSLPFHKISVNADPIKV